MKLRIIILLVLFSSLRICFSQSVDCFITKQFNVSIFPASYEAKGLYLDYFKRFTPIRFEVIEAEGLLKKQIKKIVKSSLDKNSLFRVKHSHKVYRRLRHYNRLYFGYINESGERVLMIEARWIDRENFKECETEYDYIFHGGASIWNIEFNLNTKTFSGFGTHDNLGYFNSKTVNEKSC
ncbi:MAG: hypothetical protein JNL70_22580 [Saprospiraceae bacterium]|nr:hypothetical protein [Saprospiraceae bacterium]